MNIRDLIASHANDFTSSERKIANLLLSNDVAGSSLTAAEIASETGVSSSTVVRFAQRLGLDGWLALQAEYKANTARNRLTDLPPSEEHFLTEWVALEQENLASITDQQDALSTAATLVANAHTVWVTGNRLSSFVASVLLHFLHLTRPGVRELHGDAHSHPDQLLDCSANDVVIVSCVSRYTQTTLDLVRYLASRMQVVLITDEFSSPLIPYATAYLHVQTRSISSWRSSTALFGLAQVLVMATARKIPNVQERLNRAEDLWEYFHTYTEE